MKLLIAGGGTGGHLYPGIAIAEEVTARGGQVLFVGTARGMETKLVPAAGFELQLLDVSGLKRTGVGGMVRGLLRLPKAFFASLTILRRFRPDLVLGVGGYASGPIVFTAALTRRPTAIQEQNSYPGITNRILGRLVRRIFIAFDDARRFFKPEKTVLSGNPVRRRFTEAVPGDAAEALEPPSLLVVGGSQGARAVNDLVVGAAKLLAARGQLPTIVHQTGAADLERVAALYREAGLDGRVEHRPYIDDMPAALRRAALVVGRAGALTLAELGIVGRPAILIPLPTAADDHQTRNAAELERAGAAILMKQAEATPAMLADTVAGLMADGGRRVAMSSAMKGLGRPRAAYEIVDALTALASRG